MEKPKPARKIATWTIVLNALTLTITIFAFPLAILLSLVLGWLGFGDGTTAGAIGVLSAIILYYCLLGATITLDIIYIIKSHGPRPLKAFAITSIVCIILYATDLSFTLAQSRL